MHMSAPVTSVSGITLLEPGHIKRTFSGTT